MLQAMRRGTKSPIMKFFLLFLAAGFALWGIGDVTTGLIGGSDKAISASEESISPREVAIEFERTRRNYMPESSVGDALQNGLLSDVMGSLSRDALFRAESRSLGLTVTRDMQRKAIINEKSFQDEDGVFSEGRFMQILAGAGMAELDYLRRVDNILMRDQLLDSLSSGVRFDHATALAIAAFDLEKRIVRLTSFPVRPETIEEPKDSDVDTFFAENKSAYNAPELRSVTIATISADMIAESLEIKETDVKATFENRVDEFSKPETRNIRQMVFEDIEKARSALARLDEGEEFNAVAADMLNWTEADTNLGTVAKASLDPALSEIAFSVNSGKPTGPIETAFGQHIIIVDKITLGGQAVLADVKDQIIDMLRAEQSIDLLYDKVNEFEDVIGSGATLAEAIKKVGGSLVNLENISRNGLDIDGNRINGDGAELAQDTAVLDLIWSSDINETSVIQEGGNDMFFAVLVNSETPEQERMLADVRDRVIADWKQAEAIKKAKANAEAAAQQNDDNGSLSEPFRRNGLGFDHQAAGIIADQAFNQAKNSSGVIETGSEVIAVKTVEIVAASDAEVTENGALVVEILNDALKEDMLNMMLLYFSESHDLKLNSASVRRLLVGTE